MRRSLGRLAADHYTVLSVGRSASQEEIKSTFFGLAKTLHPDVNGGCEQKTRDFKMACDAYEILSDPAKRAEYDMALGAGGGAGGSGGSPHRSQAVVRRTKSDIKAPRTAPTGSASGAAYNYQEWTQAHYGESIRTETRSQRQEFSRSARGALAHKAGVVSRMQARREARRRQPPPDEGGACTVQ
uniref:J domain-containing protein n=1 Tax=Florenciella parvula TaxID=236787 RepID=A0A7S2FBS2_9STRA|mmetsp:Transcript_11919/g.25171  ORF Transcript_11919/g.25171 Transcript_11919/m.25171 type:complete len:185 (+) Transcript_11919:144-698(+)